MVTRKFPNLDGSPTFQCCDLCNTKMNELNHEDNFQFSNTHVFLKVDIKYSFHNGNPMWLSEEAMDQFNIISFVYYKKGSIAFGLYNSDYNIDKNSSSWSFCTQDCAIEMLNKNDYFNLCLKWDNNKELTHVYDAESRLEHKTIAIDSGMR